MMTKWTHTSAFAVLLLVMLAMLGFYLVVGSLTSDRAQSQPPTNDRNNPRYKTITADTGFFVRGVKIYNIYVDSASLFGMQHGMTLVLDTSGGRRRLIAGAAGAGSITVSGDGTAYTGLDRLDLDTAQFDVLQTLAGRLSISLPQNLGPWHSPTFNIVTVQPGGGMRWYGPNGLKYTTVYGQNSAGNFVGLPAGNGILVNQAVTPLSISATGVISFDGIVPINQGGTNASVPPPAGSVIYSNGSAYLGISGGSGYILRFSGASPPTAYDLFNGPNVFTGRMTVDDAIYADSLYVRGTYFIPPKTGRIWFGANDTARVTLASAVDTNWIPTVTLGSDPGQPVSYYAYIIAATHELVVVSKTSGVAGIALNYSVALKTN